MLPGLPDSIDLATLVARAGPVAASVAAAIGLGVLEAALRSGASASRITPDGVLLVRAADGSYDVTLRSRKPGAASAHDEPVLVRDVGALFFFSLRGRLPWAADSFDATASGAAGIVDQLALAPDSSAPATEAAQALFDWALAPADRGHTAAELRRRLELLGPPARLRFDLLVHQRSGSHDPRTGGLVGGRYRLERVIGRGQMATVFAARTIGSGGGSRVAVKLIEERAIGMGDVDRRDERRERLQRRLERELRSFARVQHPNVTATIDIGFDAVLDAPFVVMELLTGQDMATALEERGRLDVGDAVESFHQACLGLAAIHRAGFVHRDVKPANLFLHRPSPDAACTVKVCDFGLARSMLELDPDAATRSGVLLGSPAYIAPEQIRDPRAADARSDVWSIGVSLYHALAGSLPWRASGVGPTLAAIGRRDAEPLAARAPDVPAALVAIVERAMALRPEDRFPSMEHLATALARSSAPRPAPPPTRARPAVGAVVGAAALAVGAVVLALASAGGDRSTRQRDDESSDAPGPAPSLSAGSPAQPSLDWGTCPPASALDYRVRGLSLRTVHERATRAGFKCAASMQISAELSSIHFESSVSPFCSFNLFYGRPAAVGAARDPKTPDRSDADSSFGVVGNPACPQPVDASTLLGD